MSGEYELGDFEDSSDPHVMDIFCDYIDSYEDFNETYFNVVGYYEKITISINEYDGLVESIEVGQRALRLGGELETMKPTEEFLDDRTELIAQVSVLLDIKKNFDGSPGRIDFNIKKQDLNWGKNRGF